MIDWERTRYGSMAAKRLKKRLEKQGFTLIEGGGYKDYGRLRIGFVLDNRDVIYWKELKEKRGEGIHPRNRLNFGFFKLKDVILGEDELSLDLREIYKK